ncbi:DUF885 family protein [Pseudonocardia cypriaca]|uniref:DUF885 family protein n=1 Tax=Pseudonocardia cypriaca TaxID=882449 RepID=UPI00115000E9|nr:DUF885 family protein [Pseudonocardia cypriaca]
MGLDGLAGEFWAWRAATQPDSYDDITRIERPAGWVADWSPGAVQGRRRALASFVERYRELDLTSEPVAVQVDGRLLGCALARVHWELELLRGWERNPRFHLDQALVPIYNRLLEPPPIDAARAEALLRHLRRVPVVLAQARENLAGRAAPSFAEHAVRALDAADARLRTAMHALTPHLPRLQAAGLPAATDLAAAALVEYREWLEVQLPSFTGPTAPGPAAFAFFLHRSRCCRTRWSGCARRAARNWLVRSPPRPSCATGTGTRPTPRSSPTWRHTWLASAPTSSPSAGSTSSGAS